MKMHRSSNIKEEDQSTDKVPKIGIVRDRLAELRALSTESDVSNEDRRRDSGQSFGQLSSFFIEFRENKEGKKIKKFLQKVELMNTTIECFENDAEMLRTLNHSIYEDIQNTSDLTEAYKKLQSDLYKRFPMILLELEKIEKRNKELEEKLEEDQIESAYLRIRKIQYSLLSQRAATAIINHLQNNVAYPEKCDERAGIQFIIVSDLTHLPSEIVREILIENDPNNAQVNPNRLKVRTKIFAKYALYVLEFLRTESERIDSSNENLSKPIFLAIDCLALEYDNDAQTSIQYQLERVKDFSSKEMEPNKRLLKRLQMLSKFFHRKIFAIVMFVFIVLIIELFIAILYHSQ